jgi:murein L,D-transpeptidase YcbB/YkuD
MDKKTKNYLMYAAGAVAAYLGYNYYKKQQGKAQTPTGPATGPAPAPKTAPSSPTFQGASQAYIKNVKILQSLLGVTADGIIGPITIKAGQAAGINYQINAATIDKAIAAAQTYKNKPGSFFDFINRK